MLYIIEAISLIVMIFCIIKFIKNWWDESIIILPQNKDYILHTLYPEKYKDSNLFSVVRNSKVNTRLRNEALLEGQEMHYRFLTKSQVEQLAASGNDELFAVFNKNAKGESLGESYNIAFKESDEQKIDEALNSTTKRKI